MLSATERITVRQVLVRLRARNLADAEALLRSVLEAPKRRGRPAAEAPMLPGLTFAFRCPKLLTLMPVEDCLVRRSRIWPSGGGKGCPRHDECRACSTGEANALLRPDFVPPPSTLAAEVLSSSQRMAKRARALVGLGDDEVVRVNVLDVAARMTPDDSGTDYTP